MSALDLLRRLFRAGAELHVQSGVLRIRGNGPPLDPPLLAELRSHKAQLQRLVDGWTCRWCQGPIVWREMPGTVALADGTSLHAWCRPAFDEARRRTDPFIIDLPAATMALATLEIAS